LQAIRMDCVGTAVAEIAILPGGRRFQLLGQQFKHGSYADEDRGSTPLICAESRTSRVKWTR
jgi:hypothetical protein